MNETSVRAGDSRPLASKKSKSRRANQHQPATNAPIPTRTFNHRNGSSGHQPSEQSVPRPLDDRRFLVPGQRGIEMQRTGQVDTGARYWNAVRRDVDGNASPRTVVSSPCRLVAISAPRPENVPELAHGGVDGRRVHLTWRDGGVDRCRSRLPSDNGSRPAVEWPSGVDGNERVCMETPCVSPPCQDRLRSKRDAPGPIRLTTRMIAASSRYRPLHQQCRRRNVTAIGAMMMPPSAAHTRIVDARAAIAGHHRRQPDGRAEHEDPGPASSSR